MAITAQMRSDVAALYAALFGRAPEASGLNYWVGELDKGVSFASVAQTMFNTEPARAYYPASMTNAEIVASFYTNVLGRTGDAEGLAFWEAKLNNGASKGDLIAEMIQTVVNYNGTDAAGLTSKALFDNKVSVGVYFAHTLGKDDVALAKDVLALVTATDKSAAEVKANAGSTFTLTNSATADSLIGTAANDTFNGAAGTVANGDLIIDQSTTDVDTANLVLTAAYAPSKIANVENVNLDWDAYGTASYNLTGVTGAKNVNLTSSKVGFLGSATVTGADGVTLKAGAGMTGTLTASGFKTGTVEGGSAKTLVVDGTATNTNNASIVVNAGASTTSVTVGATNGFISTKVNAGTATTVAVTDAGNATDTTDLTVNANATITNGTTGAMTLTASNGNNITMNAIGASLTVKGEGDVVLNSTGLTTETVTNSKSAGTLTIKTNVTTAQNLAKVQATTIEMSGIRAGADTVANGANLKYTGGGAIEVIVGGTGTSDAVTAEITAAAVTSLTATGVETLTVKSAATDVSGADVTIGTLATKGNTVKLTGTNDVAISAIAVTGEANGKVDASGLTGALTLAIDTTADSENFSVLGGTGKLTLTTANITGEQSAVGQAADDTVTANATTTGSMTAILGDGKNTVSATGLTTGTLVVTGGSGIDTVTAGAALTTGVINLNLGDGNNVINLDDAAGAGTRVVTTGGGDDTLSFTGGLDNANDVLTWTAGAGTDVLNLVTADGQDLSGAKVTLTDVEVIRIAADVDNDVTTNTKLAASVLSGKTFTIKAAAYDADTSIGVVGAATTSTIDLSTLTIDQSVTAAVSTVYINGSANTTTAQTITGTAVKDIITGGAKNDTIVAGNGADTITGGDGDDSIDVTETVANSAVDVIVLNAAGSGVDTITGFKTGTDQITLGNAATASAAGAAEFATTAGTVGSGVAFDISDVAAATTDVIEIGATLTSNGNLALAKDGTELLKALSTSATTAASSITLSAGADTHLVAYQNGDAYIYFASSADATLNASEITLVGVVKGITAGALVAADFIEI